MPSPASCRAGVGLSSTARMPIRSGLVWLLLCLAIGPLPGRAADPSPTDRTTRLEDRLKVGLRARLPAEEDFIETVASLVRAGTLPGKLVDSTYFWAIERRKDYPFPAFEKALRLQAKKIGVRL